MTFEFNPRQYIEASDRQLLWGQRLVSELKFRGHESILDLGCGDGRLTALLALQVPQGSVVGIDASRQMTAAARERHHLQTNLSFRTLDINHLCCQGEFDVIFSNAALHWVLDHRRLFANVHRALKAQGLIRFNFAGHHHCPHLIHILKRTIAEPEFALHFKDFTWPWNMPSLETTRNLTLEAGFTAVQAWKEDEDTRFPGSESLIGWLDEPCLVPFMQTLKNRQQQLHFRRRVIEDMVEQTQQPDGTFVENFRRINVVAQKTEQRSHEPSR